MNSPASLNPAMTISPELQAKIDALDNEELKARILRVLTGPGKKSETNEVIYETIMGGHALATDQQARLRPWKEDEVVAFASYFYKEWPERYITFLQQERDHNEIEAGFAWGVLRLIWVWMPDLSHADATGLFGRFRDYAKSNAI